MNSTEIARQLLARINAPRGSVTILAEPEEYTGFALRVWVRSDALLECIPDHFLGHPVIIQQAPKFSTDY